MTSKKRELEIVYNLEWKNKPVNGDEKSNMVGILDIPATTLNWKTFKSYLLKNSGAADENVKVSYIDTEDREKPINSQVDFEIALYSFRHKARMNEIITLKLDCVNSKKGIAVKSSIKEVSEAQFKIKPKIKKSEEPPEWFLNYMKKFKDELIEEISTLCSSKAHQMNIHHARKLKAESYKRVRKQPLLLAEAINDKELSKFAKIERKLESKLEKLEHKTMKIKAKKMALRGSSDSDVGRSSSKNETAPNYLNQASNDVSMNASIIKSGGIPHMVGGEHYCQTWEICNSGILPWTADTELRYAWGSQVLKPVSKEVPCPRLGPGEKGTITVVLDVPKTPGSYECYWHFYDKGRRFGHWLGCEIIVDYPPVKNTPYIPSSTYEVINIPDNYELVLPTCLTRPRKTEDFVQEPSPNEIPNPFCEDDPNKLLNCFPLNLLESNILQKQDDTTDSIDGNIELRQDNIKQEMNNANFSDTDNQSIISISDSSVNSATSDDFVMLKMSSPKTEKNMTPEIEEHFTSIPSNPNLTAMNVSSLDALVNMDNLYTKLSELSIENATFADDMTGNELKIDYDAKIETGEDASLIEEKKGMANQSGNSSVVQQTPIDLSNKSIQEDIQNETGYAYVHYQGRKIPISKKHLSAEYLTTAESVPESKIDDFSAFKIDNENGENQEQPVRDTNVKVYPSISVATNLIDESQLQNDDFCSLYDELRLIRNECSSTCGLTNSMTNSTSNENRFFVFPQHYPGYEVVPPLLENSDNPNLMQYQQAYELQNFGEILINDWSTGLNYSSCTMYPNSAIPPYNPTPTSSPNTSRGCSSIPNSNGDNSPVQQPPKEPKCFCNEADAHYVNSRHVPPRIPLTMPENSNATAPFDDYSGTASVHTNIGASCGNSGNFSAGKSNSTNPPKPPNRGVPDLLSGATVVATSAINTARNVLNMFVPPRNTECGRWQNGHWVSTNPESKREKNLRLLFDMGFYDRDLNATLLARYNDDINAVISELLQ